MMYKPSRTRGPLVSHNENYVAFISKPPKPPSWRDFLPDAKEKSGKNANIDFTDLSLVQRSNTADSIEPSNSLSAVNMNASPTSGTVHSGIGMNKHNQPITASNAISMGPSEKLAHKQRKKTKARIHRTRSHMTISDNELPSEVPTGNMAVSLANSKPREFGLKKKNVFDDRVYLDDNNRRCQRWLASLEECAPLEDVAFAQGAGVELVIPEETWSASATRHSPVEHAQHDTSTTSDSGDDSERPSENASTAVHRIVVPAQRNSQSPGPHSDESRTDIGAVHEERTVIVHSANDCNVTSLGSGSRILSPVEEVELNLPGMSSMKIEKDQTKPQSFATESAVSHL